MRISFVCDGDNEYWILPNGGISIYLPDFSSDNNEVISPKSSSPLIEAQVHESHVKISWTDPLNKLDDYYLIERSVDGKTFDFLGYTKTGVLKDNTIVYSYTDNSIENYDSIYKITTYNTRGGKLNVIGVASIREGY